MKRKGYIFTVSTLFLLSSVLVLALFFSSEVDTIDLTGPKLSALYDDVRGDLYELLDLSITVQHTANLTTVSFNDSIPSTSVRRRLENYANYLAEGYSGAVTELIESREGSLAAADISINLENSTLRIKPHDYLYRYDNLSKSRITIYPSNSSPQPYGYALRITLDQNVSSPTVDIDAGDLLVYINVTAGDLTYYRRMMVSRDGLSTWSFEALNGSFEVSIGKLQVDNLNRTSALMISTNSVSANAITSVSFTDTSLVTVESGFNVTIRDILWDARLASRIWFIKD